MRHIGENKKLRFYMKNRKNKNTAYEGVRVHTSNPSLTTAPYKYTTQRVTDDFDSIDFFNMASYLLALDTKPRRGKTTYLNSEDLTELLAMNQEYMRFIANTDKNKISLAPIYPQEYCQRFTFTQYR